MAIKKREEVKGKCKVSTIYFILSKPERKELDRYTICPGRLGGGKGGEKSLASIVVDGRGCDNGCLQRGGWKVALNAIETKEVKGTKECRLRKKGRATSTSPYKGRNTFF